jgi:N6-L-threonylcarbamoyladenine synthase
MKLCGTKVVSGGVACNEYIRQKLGLVCDAMGFQLKVPPPKLCTDNGVMIAWNGVERWVANVGVTNDLDAVEVTGK